MTYKEIVALHVKQFGVEPVITGVNVWQSDKLPELILDSIDKGVPYIESQVPDQVET